MTSLWLSSPTFLCIENEAIKTTKTVEILHNTKRKVGDESHKDVTKPSRWQS